MASSSGSGPSGCYGSSSAALKSSGLKPRATFVGRHKPLKIDSNQEEPGGVDGGDKKLMDQNSYFQFSMDVFFCLSERVEKTLKKWCSNFVEVGGNNNYRSLTISENKLINFIGNHGEVLEDIENTSNCHIEISKPSVVNTTQRHVRLHGTTEGMDLAEILILDAIADVEINTPQNLTLEDLVRLELRNFGIKFQPIWPLEL